MYNKNRKTYSFPYYTLFYPSMKFEHLADFDVKLIQRVIWKNKPHLILQCISSVIYTQILLNIITWLNKQQKSSKNVLLTQLKQLNISQSNKCTDYVSVPGFYGTKLMRVIGFLWLGQRPSQVPFARTQLSLGGLGKCT